MFGAWPASEGLSTHEGRACQIIKAAAGKEIIQYFLINYVPWVSGAELFGLRFHVLETQSFPGNTWKHIKSANSLFTCSLVGMTDML